MPSSNLICQDCHAEQKIHITKEGTYILYCPKCGRISDYTDPKEKKYEGRVYRTIGKDGKEYTFNIDATTNETDDKLDSYIAAEMLAIYLIEDEATGVAARWHVLLSLPVIAWKITEPGMWEGVKRLKETKPGYFAAIIVLAVILYTVLAAFGIAFIYTAFVVFRYMWFGG